MALESSWNSSRSTAAAHEKICYSFSNREVTSLIVLFCFRIWRLWILDDVAKACERMVMNPLGKEIADLQNRLAELDRERASVLTALEQLKLQRTAEEHLAPTSPIVEDAATVTAMSSADKIALFRSLFRGRDDVFPRRWENSKTGKVGYALACRNEWVRGICEKPRIKCSNCPNQAFVPVSDEVVRKPSTGQGRR
jgi:hypothetical protein